jgi:uncharacterized protein (DUF1330 family)
MAAYIIAQVEVPDPVTFAQYRAQVPAVIEECPAGVYTSRMRALSCACGRSLVAVSR